MLAMAFQTRASLTSAAPLDILPVYARRDPETSSIRSSAPSYVSDAPTYHSSVPAGDAPPAPPPRTGLPKPTYAPGFGPPTGACVGDFLNHSFNINEWSPVTSGHQARHYQNVANRRATLAVVSEEARLNALSRNLALLSTNAPPGESEGSNPQALREHPNHQPASPQEDPDLVGTEAAEAARERRLYLQKCWEEREALRQESMSWDFMISQMADWKERERSWQKFRAEVGRNKVFGGRGSRILGRRLR